MPDCTLIARFADVRDMLQMPKIYTVDLYKPKMSVTGLGNGFLMAHDDDALHYREKSLMQGLLNRDDLPRVRKLVAETAKQILSHADREFDLVNKYCRMVPVYLVQEHFGLDGVGRKDLIRWSYWNQYDAFNNQPFDRDFDKNPDSDYSKIVRMHDKASQELGVYIALLMVRKLIRLKFMNVFYMVLNPIQKLIYRLLGMTPPKCYDVMVTRMLRSKFAEQVDFPLTRVGVNAGGLLIGAIETTSQAVAQVVEYFIDRPDLLREAKDKAGKDDTTAFDAMVWEALRFVPIRPDIFRQASTDYTIVKGTEHEMKTKAGIIVRLLTHSAMFDPNAYENPDQFNPDRNFYHNFILGYGPHQCLGKHIAMEMVPEMVRQVVVLNDLTSQGEISYVNKEFFPGREGPFPEFYQVSWS